MIYNVHFDHSDNKQQISYLKMSTQMVHDSQREVRDRLLYTLYILLSSE